MLGVKKYEQKYIDSCKNNIKQLMSAYKKTGTTSSDNFEYLFLNNMVVALDAFFVHRVRAIEGKDCNPLNEVRMLADSILRNFSKLALDKTIKYSPEKSVLKFQLGEDIQLSTKEFQTLADAFFTEIEKKYL